MLPVLMRKMTGVKVAKVAAKRMPSARNQNRGTATTIALTTRDIIVEAMVKRRRLPATRQNV
jgi:hypothetical protein